MNGIDHPDCVFRTNLSSDFRGFSFFQNCRDDEVVEEEVINSVENDDDGDISLIVIVLIPYDS